MLMDVIDEIISKYEPELTRYGVSMEIESPHDYVYDWTIKLRRNGLLESWCAVPPESSREVLDARINCTIGLMLAWELKALFCAYDRYYRPKNVERQIISIGRNCVVSYDDMYFKTFSLKPYDELEAEAIKFMKLIKDAYDREEDDLK